MDILIWRHIQNYFNPSIKNRSVYTCTKQKDAWKFTLQNDWLKISPKEYIQTNMLWILSGWHWIRTWLKLQFYDYKQCKYICSGMPALTPNSILSIISSIFPVVENATWTGTWTLDPQIKSLMLCRLSYPGSGGMGLCLWIWLINNDYLSLYPCTPTLSVSVVCVCVCVCVCARVCLCLSLFVPPANGRCCVYVWADSSPESGGSRYRGSL